MIHKIASPSEGVHWFEEHALFVRFVISRNTHHRMEVLTALASGEEALPVFSTYRAANQYLQSGDFGRGWHVRESTAGELISLLMGHIADVETVALNPYSALTGGVDASSRLVSKNAFIGSLMKEPMLLSSN